MTFDHITPQWLESKMKEHSKKGDKLTNAKLARELNLNERTIALWKNGKEIGSTARPLLYYYFQNLECQKSK